MFCLFLNIICTILIFSDDFQMEIDDDDVNLLVSMATSNTSVVSGME
jgi:hypothetical protein